MNNLKKVLLLSLLIVFALSTTLSAYAMNASIERNSGDDSIVVSGSTPKSEIITVQILPDDITPDEIEFDNMLGRKCVYVKTLKTGENGLFTFDAALDKSGEYTAYLRGQSDLDVTVIPFAYTIKSDIDEVISGMCDKLNRGEYVDSVKYIKDFFADDKEFIGYIEKCVSTDEAKEYFTKCLMFKNLKDADDLRRTAKEALILTVARYSNGVANLMSVMKTYNDEILHINSLSNKKSVYTAILGEYDDVDKLVSAYQKALKDQEGSGQQGGGQQSGGTNSSGTYTSSGFGTIRGEVAEKKDVSDEIGIKFEDLVSVEWAYKDISELFAKGIINGVTETSFKPNDLVKREEFIKMLICAMGLQNEEAEYSGFTDLQPNEWYVPYVNIAKKFGVSNGIEDNKFGIGMNISRQDMAVMLYNAMKLRGYTPTGANNTFADFELCADYANEAIAELSYKAIVNGVGDNLFEPNGVATRAQAAVILNRALSYLQ